MFEEKEDEDVVTEGLEDGEKRDGRESLLSGRRPRPKEGKSEESDL